MTGSGVVVVDKPASMTSHDVVARVRRAAGTRKVGHAGTLDPMATGVLVLGVGRATRLLGHLTLTEKAYDATIRLGVATTTDDAEGEPISAAPTEALDALADDDVSSALEAFAGEIDQVPSSVSAIKIGGRRAYERVRAGEDVALAPRRVTVHSVDLREIRRAGGFVDLDVSIACSSGTYIRAIARDLGRALGAGGHLTALRRTRVGPFSLRDATAALADLRPDSGVGMLPMGEAAARVFPHVRVDAETAREIGYGRRLTTVLPAAGGPVAMLDASGELLALYEQRGEVAVPLAVLV